MCRHHTFSPNPGASFYDLIYQIIFVLGRIACCYFLVGWSIDLNIYGMACLTVRIVHNQLALRYGVLLMPYGSLDHILTFGNIIKGDFYIFGINGAFKGTTILFIGYNHLIGHFTPVPVSSVLGIQFNF